MSALDNLRGVVRIAKAASIGVSGNGLRQSAPRATERPAPATAPPADDGFIDDAIPFISQRGGW